MSNRLSLSVLIALTAAVLAPVARAVEFSVDCTAAAGRIRPLHGVNNGPLNFGETIDLSAGYRQLAVPLVRLHDSEWPNPDIVDIHAIFPDMTADPASPESYDFRRTDTYIQAIVDTGAQIVYRLGESIEHTSVKYHVHPPHDPDKWARVCLGIIKHYNTGWAAGHHHNIRYWEIWNEPENRPSMWTGSDQQFYELYTTAAKAIKAAFPDLKVGGPSIGATGQLDGDTIQPIPFLEGFLRHCKQHRVPLDFFSWHTYTNDPYLYSKKARPVRRLLDQYGFQSAEIHLNEWNYLPDNDWIPMLDRQGGASKQLWYEKMGGPRGAAFVATVLMDLQDSPVDHANYYSGDSSYFGLFNRYGVPKKTFHAVHAFKMLTDTPVRVPVESNRGTGPIACAGMSKDNTRLNILIANYSDQSQKVQLNVEGFGRCNWQALRLDSTNDLAPTASGTADPDTPITQPLPAPSVVLLNLTKSPSR